MTYAFVFTNMAAFVSLILSEFCSCLDNVINDSLFRGEAADIPFIHQLD